MGLMDNIKKQLGSQFIEIIEWLDDTTDTLVWRFPGYNQEIKMGAQLIVRVHAERIFPNCPRYIHRMGVVEPSPYVPRDGQPVPVPKWKCMDDFRDVLARDDPARSA